MYNDTKTIYNKKLYVGLKNTGKKMYVELTIDPRIITGYKTLSICGNGGQNIKEIADIKEYKELFIGEQDLQTIIKIWEKWHLNSLKAGCIHMDKPEEGKSWDHAEWERLTKQCPNDYKYGSKWLVEELPENIITEIINIFEKYTNEKHIDSVTDKVIFKNFQVKVNFRGDKLSGWDKNNRNNYLITVTNKETKQRITFEFWASITNPELEKEYDILNAFYCFVSDAVSGSESFEDFCSNLGYDEDSRTAEKIYKACQRSLTKLEKIYDGDIYDLVNELQEVVG